MKNILFKSTLFSLTFLLFACSDTEKPIDQVFDDTTTGGVLRTLESSTDIPVNNPDASVELLLEIQDVEDGDLSDYIEVSASFKNFSADGANDRDEVPLKTISNSEWIYGNRLPRALVTVTISELQAALNLQDGDYTGGDRFIIRVELVFKDGRRWSNHNASQTVLGNLFYASPFAYNANVVCPFNDQSLAGEHTYVTTNMYIPGANPCGGTAMGSVIWSETTTEGSYTTSDFSFGVFASCWGDSPATSSAARVEWFCNSLETAGTDQYGENWTYEIISVNGPEMVIEFVSTYLTGEGGITTITREGGEDWPDIFQN